MLCRLTPPTHNYNSWFLLRSFSRIFRSRIFHPCDLVSHFPFSYYLFPAFLAFPLGVRVWLSMAELMLGLVLGTRADVRGGDFRRWEADAPWGRMFGGGHMCYTLVSNSSSAINSVPRDNWIPAPPARPHTAAKLRRRPSRVKKHRDQLRRRQFCSFVEAGTATASAAPDCHPLDSDRTATAAAAAAARPREWQSRRRRKRRTGKVTD